MDQKELLKAEGLGTIRKIKLIQREIIMRCFWYIEES